MSQEYNTIGNRWYLCFESLYLAEISMWAKYDVPFTFYGSMWVYLQVPC